jgi:SNF2 family DNA or RNA helicase
MYVWLVGWLVGWLVISNEGGVLGDDMGLGKSVQISAFLCGVFNLFPQLKCLIVAPLSLLEEPWEKELQTWAPKVCALSPLLFVEYSCFDQ